MTTLVQVPLRDELEQEITYNLERRVHVSAFIPYLYIHNASADFFTFELSNSDGVIFSKNFTVAEIKASLDTTDDYIHVFYPIIPTNPVQLERGSYTAKLIAGTGYVYTKESFIGWIKQHENVQNVMDYEPLDASRNAYSLRYKENKEGIL